MDEIAKEMLISRIRTLDPNEEIVKLDIANNKISYNSKIKQHRKIERLTGEEVVRAYYITTLNKKLEYPIESFELEDRHVIGSKTKKTEVLIDIKINKNSHPFMLFELKTPESYEKNEVNDIKTQLFKVAGVLDPRAKNLKWLCYCSVDISGTGDLEELKKVIDYKRFRTFDEWEGIGRLSHKIIPKKYGEKVSAKYIKGGIEAYKKIHKKEPNFIALDLKTTIPKEKIDKIRKDLHNTLWAGGKKEYNKIFFNLVKIILAKIYDEKETKEGHPYKFQIIYNIRENEIIENLEETYKNILDLYRNAFKDPEYLGVSDSELKLLKKREGAIDIIEFEEHEVAFILELLQEYELTESDYDFLGEFFENIIREEFKQERGQYFTHKNLVDFILYALELDKVTLDLLEKEKRLPYILDPSVGSGTFLVQAMKLVKKAVMQNKERLETISDRVKDFIKENFPETKKMVWAREYIYGTEFSPSLAITTKVNMVLHGDGHVHSYLNDALSDFETFEARLMEKKISSVYDKLVNENFDVVISNPPFSVSLDPRTKRKLDDLYIYGNKQASENLFIERWYQLLKENGRLGVVLPESVFDTTDNMYIRIFLFKYFWIKAIVSLAGGKRSPFAPHTATKTCLLFAQKKTERDVREWETLWKRYLNEFRKTKKELVEKLGKETLELGENAEQRKSELIKYFKIIFKDNFEEKDKNLKLNELIEKYKPLLKEKKLEEWWIFTEVSKILCKYYPSKASYPIFHVLEVGFKRTKRGERKRPNQLYSTNEEGDIVINTKNPAKVLDIIRGDVKWS